MTKPCAPCYPIHETGGTATWEKRNTQRMPRAWSVSSESTGYPFATSKKKILAINYAIVNQTIGEGMKAYRREKLSRYETHLDREFGHTLIKLIR